jgi:hypothetical protein
MGDDKILLKRELIWRDEHGRNSKITFTSNSLSLSRPRRHESTTGPSNKLFQQKLLHANYSEIYTKALCPAGVVKPHQGWLDHLLLANKTRPKTTQTSSKLSKILTTESSGQGEQAPRRSWRKSKPSLDETEAVRPRAMSD